MPMHHPPCSSRSNSFSLFSPSYWLSLSPLFGCCNYGHCGDATTTTTTRCLCPSRLRSPTHTVEMLGLGEAGHVRAGVTVRALHGAQLCRDMRQSTNGEKQTVKKTRDLTVSRLIKLSPRSDYQHQNSGHFFTHHQHIVQSLPLYQPARASPSFDQQACAIIHHLDTEPAL